MDKLFSDWNLKSIHRAAEASLSCKPISLLCVSLFCLVIEFFFFFEVMTLQLPALPLLPPLSCDSEMEEMQFDAGPRRCSWILWQLVPAIRSHRRCLISGPQPSPRRSFLFPQYVRAHQLAAKHTRVHKYMETHTHKTYQCCPVRGQWCRKILNFAWWRKQMEKEDTDVEEAWETIEGLSEDQQNIK